MAGCSPFLLLAFACLCLAGPDAVQAREWVIGRGHRPWSEPLEKWIGLDDSTTAGVLQPRQIEPGENILGSGAPGGDVEKITDIFGYTWGIKRGELYRNMTERELGWHPRLWAGGAAEAAGNSALIDGLEDVPALFWEAPITGRPTPDDWHTLDLAIPVPIDSVAFFPPQKGLHPTLGQLYKDLFPRGYAVSRSVDPTNWLLDDAEPYDTGRSTNYHPLAETVAQTFGNTRSVIGLRFPLRFTRFLRVYFGGAIQTFAVAEVKAFGRGFPAQARYISRPVSLGSGRPVSFGRITWRLTPCRLSADGDIGEDPAAPVRLQLRTRTGYDDDPQVYHVYDELGKQQVVDQAAFAAAPPPRSTYQTSSAGYRGAVTEDTESWDPWSSPYERSGEEIRSSDARTYLQFRFELETEDPLAFARLDSIAVEYSPLLAAQVLGEVSLPGQVERGAARLDPGIDTVFVYDLQAAFDSADQDGFDGVELDVAPGARFLGLEMGRPFAAVAPDSVDSTAADRLRIFFPSRRIDRSHNPPLRLRLRGAIFQASAYFTGQVFATQGDRLPQTIASGDANPEVASNTFQVVSAQPRLRVLKALEFSPRTITPNNDRINDQLQIAFTLLGVEQAAVAITVLDLAGRPIVRLPPAAEAAGYHRKTWDGRDTAGDLVSPGIYLVRIEVDVDQGNYAELRPVAVIY